MSPWLYKVQGLSDLWFQVFWQLFFFFFQVRTVGNLCDGWRSGWPEGAPGCLSKAWGPGRHSERGLDSKGNQVQRSRRVARPHLFPHLTERILRGRSLSFRTLTTNLEEKRPRVTKGTLPALETQWHVTTSRRDCPPPTPPQQSVSLVLRPRVLLWSAGRRRIKVGLLAPLCVCDYRL